MPLSLLLEYVLLRANPLYYTRQPQDHQGSKKSTAGALLEQYKVNPEIMQNMYDYSSIPIPASVISSRFVSSSSGALRTTLSGQRREPSARY